MKGKMGQTELIFPARGGRVQGTSTCSLYHPPFLKLDFEGSIGWGCRSSVGVGQVLKGSTKG